MESDSHEVNLTVTQEVTIPVLLKNRASVWVMYLAISFFTVLSTFQVTQALVISNTRS